MQINRQTYESYFLLYVDGELTADERAEVERFAAAHPDLRQELDVLLRSVFTADDSVVFDNKEVLYREEKDRAAVIPASSATATIGWKKIAVAAAILLFISATEWLYLQKHTGAPAVPPAGNLARQSATTAPGGQHTDATPAHQQTPPAEPATDMAVSPGTTGARHRNRLPAPNRNRPHTIIALPDAAPEEDPVPTGAATPKPAAVDPYMAAIPTPGAGKIDIPIDARRLNPDIAPPAGIIRYADEDELAGSDRIYFANTSFSKKNNLRVVFRKASRIIDRITTMQ